MDMANGFEQLKQYINSHPIQFGDDCEHPALDGLYWLYSETNSMGDAQTIMAAKALHERLSGLPFETADEIFSLAGVLCAEHERLAFLAGLRLGAQLMLELMD